MPSLALLWAGMAVTSTPSKTSEPPDAFRCPEMQLNRVVFPAPLGPMIPNTSPRPTVSETLSTALSPPNVLVRPSASSSTSSTPLTHLSVASHDLAPDALTEEQCREDQQQPDDGLG